MEGMKVSEAKKEYISKTLNPILEKLVTSCLTDMPEDPQNYILQWLQKNGKQAAASGVDLAQQNEELKVAVRRMSSLMDEASKTLKTMGQKDEEEEAESEDDDDDVVDEIPERKMGGPRASVSAEAYGAWNQKTAFEPKVIEKNDEQKKRLEDVLMKSFLFSGLETAELAQVINAMEETSVEAKERPIKQGDDGDFLFVIESGTLKCYVAKDGSEIEVKTVEAGDVFGELALLYNCPRAASVEAAEKCTLWKLDRGTFNHIVKDAAQKKRERYVNFLEKVQLLNQLDSYERSQVADAFKSETYEDGQAIVRENEPGDRFYVIESGTCIAEKSGEKVMDYSEGCYFGELALLRNQPRAATVISVGKSKVLSLDRRTFKRLLGPLEQVLANKASAAYGEKK